LFLIWSPGQPCLQIHAHDTYDLRFGHSSYAWRPWVLLNLDSNKMNMDGRLTLRPDSWSNENLHLHQLRKTTTLTYEINHFDPLSQTLSFSITSNTFFHTLHKIEDSAISHAKHSGYSRGLVPWVQLKFNSDNIVTLRVTETLIKSLNL
jgi:hypothetical protein